MKSLAFSVLLLLLPCCLAARDRGQIEDVSPEVKAWVENLRDRNGVSCCATADGFKPQEVEWDIAERSYWVKIEGRWFNVPDEAVIHGQNRLGYAVVWYIHDEEYGFVIRCFLPGSET